MNEEIRQLRARTVELANTLTVTDMHTHLYAPEFGELLLWGVDELLVYHYLVSESFRWTDQPYEEFWSLSKKEQADLIWQRLFIDHSPVSEAASGFITMLNRLGIDVSSRNLDDYRAAFASRTVNEQVDAVMEIAKVDKIVMTNDPFDPLERPVWEAGLGRKDPRFFAALRVDSLLNNWPFAVAELQKQGYDVQEAWTDTTKNEVRRFLKEWIVRMDALYLAVSMPGDFAYPAEHHRTSMIDEVMIPVCQEQGIPFALMIGVRRQSNPGLKLAGDMSMKSDVSALESLCRKYPEQKFIVTMLARENQHELAVLARKFRNLMIFGCWWFLNTDSIVEEMTRFRIELLGTTMIPIHSDCRVFEQLIYKWEYSRKIVGEVLADKYVKLLESGWRVTDDEIKRDLQDMYANNFWRFLGREV